MIDHPYPYSASILRQIAAKQAEIEMIKYEREMQELLNRVTINRLEFELEVLIRLYNGEEFPPSKDDLLQAIDQALDDKDEKEFIRLSTILKTFQ